jgi:YggT family protein
MALKIAVLHAIAGFGLIPPLALLRATLLDVVGLVLRTYFFSIVLNAILSFVAPGNYSPAQSLLNAICNPVLNPIRRLIPSVAGLDLSPLWACIAIQALLLIIP